MNKRIIGSLLIGVCLLFSLVAAMPTISERDWQVLKLIARTGGIAAGTDFPANPTLNQPFLIVDDSLPGACDSGGGFGVTFCYWDGSNWLPVFSAPDTGWPTNSNTKLITWANNFLNAIRFGDGVDEWVAYRDPTDGLQFNPVCGGVENGCNRVRRLLSGFFYDIRNASDTSIFKVTESGTVTVGSGSSFTVSGLGIELTPTDSNPTCSAGKYYVYADLSETAAKLCNNGSVSTLNTTATNTETIIYKSSDEPITNSATLQNDNDFVFAVSANKTYALKIYALYDATTVADMQYDFTLPASATGFKSTHHAPTGTTACSGTSGTFIYNSVTQTDNNVGAAGAGTSTICALEIDATIVVAGTSGNVQWRWAQANLENTTITVRAGSWMSWRQVSP